MTRTLIPIHSRPPVRQQGVVLVVALILLVVLTLLGITSLNTTTLQEKMANNIQEVNRAFQAGESGLNDAFNNSNVFIPIPAVVSTGKTALLGAYSAGANYSVQYIQKRPPPPESGYSHDMFTAYYFRMTSTAGSRTSDPGGNAALNMDPIAAEILLGGGAYQIAKITP